MNDIEQILKQNRPLLLGVRKHLRNWIEAEWREYPKKKGSSKDFKDYLLLKIRKELGNDVANN